MKPLFDPEDETHLDACVELEGRAEKAIKPIIKEFSERGHSLRDIQILLTGLVFELTLEAILTKRSEKMKPT
jgi:hypothetical protein